MTRVCIGLGSNLGNRDANLRMSLRALTRLSRVTAVSSLYDTDPVGMPQPNFYNAACCIETGLEPLPLLRFLRAIEDEVGRRPSSEPGGPRPVDLDILLYGNEVVETDSVVIPHPRLAERAFVLTPLAEIAGDEMHPIMHRTIADIAAGVPRDGVRLVAERGWDGGVGLDSEPVKI